MERSVLAVRRRVRVGVVVVKDVEVGTGFRPDVVGLGRMNSRGASAGVVGWNIMVCRGVGDLLADVDHRAVNAGPRRPIHKTIDEGRIGVLKNLLDSAGQLDWLGPVVILHRDHENSLDLLRAGGEVAQEQEATTPRVRRHLTCDIETSKY